MSNKLIKMIRYNTGSDKKVFLDFKDYFNAVIFNATIVAYSGSAIADLVSIYKNQYIIDPQTHILQHDVNALLTNDKNPSKREIRKSIIKYLNIFPDSLTNTIKINHKPLSPHRIKEFSDVIVNSVYDFQTNYVNQYIEEKEYGKYLNYTESKPKPVMIIAPYFMCKSTYKKEENELYLEINHLCLQKFIEKNETNYPIAAQLVLDRSLLLDDYIIEKIKSEYMIDGYEYVFIWISDFSTFTANKYERIAFKRIIELFNKMGKKPLMTYGGYDSILLSHKDMANRLYGVAQSVGYGESRSITPVGGGMPVNKYYYLPLHRRMRFDEALDILMNAGYFSNTKSVSEHARDYYMNICSCKQCHEIIKNDINNFKVYNDSKPFYIKTKHGIISRNRPTSDAMVIAAYHFLHCKVTEWEDVVNKDLNHLLEQMKINTRKYGNTSEQMSIQEWCDIFAK